MLNINVKSKHAAVHPIAVVRSYIYKYAVVHTSDRDDSLPGHALLEKGVQRQRGVGPLVSSQEQRALLVPLINRG